MQLFRLALADLRRDWALSLCQVFALAAVLTPLLVLAGLHQGVLGQLMGDLRANPGMREITPRVTGANRFTESWIAQAAARPDVAFIVGDARFTADAVTVTLAGRTDQAGIVATLVPSAANDPLRGTAPQWASGRGSVVLSQRAARQIGARAGDRLTMHVPHVHGGADGGRDLAVTVAALLPPDRMPGRQVILADAPLVLAIQHFRDDYAVPELGWPGEPPPPGPPHYERFRMYARRINDVSGLVDWLQAQGIEPNSRIEDIAPVTALDHGLSVVLGIIAAFAAGGLIVAVAATQWNGVQRKQRELALLALIGYDRRFLVAMTLLEALILGALGIVMSLFLFGGAALSIDHVFATVQRLAGPACQLTLADIMLVSALTLALTVVAAALAAWHISRIEPAGLLRDA